MSKNPPPAAPPAAPPPPDGDTLKRYSRQIDQAFEAAARASGSPIPAADFYIGLLNKAISAIEAPAGAIWFRTPQGFLQLQCQINFAKVGLDEQKGGRQGHNELLRAAFLAGTPQLVEANSSIKGVDGVEATNMAPYPVVLAPILTDDKQTVGILELWLDPNIDPRFRPSFFNFVVQMAGYGSAYIRNTTNRRSTTQEAVYSQLETFSRQIHSSLNPTEVAFTAANEGRRLVGCDRISVGVRHGRKTSIEAVSGADVVEKAGTHVKRMRHLFDAVLEWNEKLIYKGERDETLPPRVLEALDAYLAESNPKLLVLTPLRDQREVPKDKDNRALEGKPNKARSGLLLEAFEPPEPPDQMLQRFDVVGGHAATALYNASEMKRVPMKWAWMPVMFLQGKTGGKSRFYAIVAAVALVVIITCMVVIPYPLKLDAKGQLLPEERHYIYPTNQGAILTFKVKPKDEISAGTELAIMQDQEGLGKEYQDKVKERLSLDEDIKKLLRESQNSTNPDDRKKAEFELSQKQSQQRSVQEQLDSLVNAHHMTQNPKRAGEFRLLAPEFPPSRRNASAPVWRVVSNDFEDQLKGKWVKPTDPVLRVGNTSGAWLIEQKIPQKHIGQVRKAFKTKDPREYLEVDILLLSAPTEPFRGRLYQGDIGAMAQENKTEQDETEAVVIAYVHFNEPDTPVEYRIPERLLITGVEAKTKIRCPGHCLGYSLFYGVWEFLYERVIFFF